VISKEEFLDGEDCGTLKEEIKKLIMEFLSEDHDKAYPSTQIYTKILKYLPRTGFIPLNLIALLAFDELIEERKIICKKFRKELYYTLR
jgi:hypothetical protein